MILYHGFFNPIFFLASLIIFSPCHTKLNTDNYMVWKVQITAYLKGQDLYSFVDGSLPSPPKLLETKCKPAYLSWHQIDQLLLSFLFVSLSDGIFGHVISSTTSSALWTSLESMFGSHSQVKKFQVWFQLKTC